MLKTKDDIKNKIRIAAFVADLVVVNCAILLVQLLLGEYGLQENATNKLCLYLAILNVCFIPPFLLFELPFYSRFFRDEIVVERSMYTSIVHVVLSLLALFAFGLEMPSRSMVMGLFFLEIILISMERLTLRHSFKQYREEGEGKRNVVIVGESKAASEIIEVMKSPDYNYNVIAHITDEDNAIDFLKENKEVNELYSAIASNKSELITSIYRYCERNFIHFYAISNYQGLLNHKMSISYMGNVAILALRNEPLRKMRNKIMKRLFDLLISSLYLCLIHPFVFVIVASIIKMTSKGPVYFKQERSGMNGKTFTIYKFRSMCVNDKADELQATANDSRKTKFGDFIRKTNIDELPQFINVWKGDMSVVGPRPHMLKHTEEYSKLIDEYMVRHFVKPGITGWAQITGFRGETPRLADMEGRVKQDIWYIENWTFWLDIKIIFITFFDTLIGEKRGA